MSTSTCPIVGIGASAGGLAVLKVFFEALPIDTGAAFVVIQHLEPNHESFAAEILERSTAMPTMQVSEGMKVEPNHVYVIPPNTYLTLRENAFQLAKPTLHHGLRMPIDAFLWSLAEQHQERAIAIIISGTGSDGSLGLKAIKGGGGLVLAQSPETAEYDGMPRSAIATGMVDIACPVEDIPKHLIDYLQNPSVIELTKDEEDEPIAAQDKQHLSAILALLQTRCNQDFRVYKHGTIGRRIKRRMGLHHIKSMEDYLTFMRAEKDEATLLFKDLLIGVTAFFRDAKAFEALNKAVILPLLAAKHTDDVIRVWIPGCASGEEAYSIAMLLIEALGQANKHCPIKIFATDIDEAALGVGRNGLYAKNSVANLSTERLKRFFNKEGDFYRVSKTLRESVTFANQNMISDPPFSNLDLISCRNLLIYLKPEVQTQVLALFHFALRENAHLFLGHSETANQQEELFEAVVKKWRIYRRCAASRATKLDFPIGSSSSISKPSISPKTNSNTGVNLNDVVQQYLIKEFSPAAVLVNHKHQILHFSGPTSRYLEQPGGAPTQDLLTLVKHELRPKLRAALRRVVNERQRVVVDDVTVLRDDVKVAITVILRPLMLTKIPDPVILITFEDQLEVPVVSQDQKAQSNLVEPSLLQQMADELHITREDLQSNIEELESANEELQAANEEVMSINEELQSSNEELESSKEELQSMNEELTTVNGQYKDKVDELANTNDDLNNLLSSTDIATLFIDEQLKIGRFTPATGRLFNLLGSDIGRPLSDIRPKFTDNSLQEDVCKVLDKLTPMECEVSTEDGKYFIRRILPYRTSENRISGVVITFIDITARKIAEENNLRLATVVRDSNDAVTLINTDGKIIAWNNGAQKMYGWSKHEAMQMSIRDLVPSEEWPKVAKLFQRLYQGEVLHSAESLRLSKDGRQLHVLITVTPIFDQAGRVTSVATTERDITARIKAEQQLRNSEANFRALVESAPDALVIVNAKGMIEVANGQAEDLFGYSRDELLSMSVEQLMPKRLAERHQLLRQQYFDEPKLRVIGNQSEPIALNKSGDEIPIEVSLSPIDMAHRRVVSASIRDIRQRKLNEEKIFNAMKQAELALSAKSRFLATASHDLRQPLHSLILLNKALLSNIDQAEAQKMLTMQGESLHGMARLLNSLLDVSKLESGTVEVQISDVMLRPILTQICAEYEAEADEKGLALSIEMDSDIIVQTDPHLLSQLLCNLLANAIRYTSEGFVKLSAKQDPKHVTITVSDSGIGIPSDQIEHIFDEFHQVARNPQQRHGGLGLGLSIVQRIASLLGSEIIVKSEVSKGSSFSISLNNGVLKPTAQIDTQIKNDTVELSNAVILLVDDDPDVLEASEILLSLEEGFKVITASSPPEAYAVLNTLTPDLIVSDLHLNHSDSGINIIKRAKTVDNKQIPCILVSGDTSSEMERIDDEQIVRLNKPVDPDMLVSLARKLLNSPK
jgi:two-component system CheB/CheR fusion protein